MTRLFVCLCIDVILNIAESILASLISLNTKRLLRDLTVSRRKPFIEHNKGIKILLLENAENTQTSVYICILLTIHLRLYSLVYDD